MTTVYCYSSYLRAILSLSFFYSLPRSMIASPFSTRTYLDRRNMATVCSVPLIRAHKRSLNCGLIKPPHYRNLPAALLLGKWYFELGIIGIISTKKENFEILPFHNIYRVVRWSLKIERRLKVQQSSKRNWLPNNGGSTNPTEHRATRFLSSNRLYRSPIISFTIRQGFISMLETCHRRPQPFEIRKSYDNKPLFAGLQHTVSRRYCAPCTCSPSLSLSLFV